MKVRSVSRPVSLDRPRFSSLVHEFDEKKNPFDDDFVRAAQRESGSGG
jgi:hypothetical protein